MRHGMTWIPICSLIVAVVPSLAAQSTPLRFEGHQWDAAGDWRVEEIDGRTALTARGGTAVLSGADLRDGTVTFSVWSNGIRSFGGIRFRNTAGVSRGEYFYIRPHQTARFDAVQYTPLFNLQSQWQVFGEYNAETALPARSWVTFRLEFRENSLRIFAGDDPAPLLVAHDLDPDASGRGIEFTVGTPGVAPRASDSPGEPTMAFAGLSISATTTLTPGRPERVTLPGAVLEAWQVSDVAAAPEVLPEEPPARLVDGRWTPLRVDHAGRLLIGKVHPVPGGNAMVVARTTVPRQAAGRARLWLGMSDRGVVFVNGRPVFRAENTYLSRSGRYLGTMTADKDAVDIDLQAGENRIEFLVAEAFGGWGVVASLEELP